LVSRGSLASLRARHIDDSAQLHALARHPVSHWVDMGSGGGFPGLVVAILALETGSPEAVTLIESDARKSAFLNTAIRELGLAATVRTERIERASPMAADVVSARALADLDTLLGFADRHMAATGEALFPKGENWEKEVETELIKVLHDPTPSSCASQEYPVPDPSQQSAPRIIAIANQKGGVGKTTTTINLGAALADTGARVLIVDLDPQGNASTGLGIEAGARNATTYDFLLDEVVLGDVVQPTAHERLTIIPATVDLSSADIELLSNEKRSFLLHDALRQTDMTTLTLDYILIDCPPSLNLLTVNAMVAAHSVLVPLQGEFFALEGLSQLMLTIREVRQNANPSLRIEGVLMTMVDSRNNLSAQVEADARENLGDLVFQTRIPRNVRVSEAPSYALPVLTYDASSKGAQAYRALAQEIIEKHARVAA
ncbi:MAG: AAA family ATPase, partial [Thioalkalivibrio sp.]